MTKKDDRRIEDLSALESDRALSLLFDRVADKLFDLEPLVGIEDWLLEEITGWLDGIRDGEELCLYYGAFGMIHRGVIWGRPAPVNGPYCGAHLLQLLGHMGKATVQYGAGNTPPSALVFLQAFASYPDSPEWLGYKRVGERDALLVLPEAEALLGLCGHVVLRKPIELVERLPQETYADLMG